jgi:mono/diheme cytochrome c family protein
MLSRAKCIRGLAGLSLVASMAAWSAAGDIPGLTPSFKTLDDAPAGYRNLLRNDYVPAQLDQEIFDNLWRIWEEPLKSQAEAADPTERRRMSLTRYGLMEAPGREGGIPLQYADDGKGGWVLNCFSCHGGKVAGQVIPGLPNTHIALETLFQEIFETKRLLGRKVDAGEASALVVPLGKSNGTTNAIIFGVVLGAYRDKDLNLNPNAPTPKMIHHDHDAPPWWHVKRKSHLYSDGFAGKGPRALMQFMLTPDNGPEAFHKHEESFKDIYAWIESLEAPKYPFAIDQSLAEVGKALFNKSCSECHGTYGDGSAFPQKIVDIDVVGTNRARLDSLSPEMRHSYEISWFSNYGEKKSITEPGGYVAQPLDGIWATAPYLHNGSVPTLYDLFYPDQRPQVWKRTEDGYDQQKIGVEYTRYDALPEDIKAGKQKRTYYNSKIFGKSVEGHTFPDELNDDEKRAVMEYLKTL